MRAILLFTGCLAIGGVLCASAQSPQTAPPPGGAPGATERKLVPLEPEKVELVKAAHTPAEKARAAAAGRAQDPREIFGRANRLYEAGDYHGALAEYDALIAQGYRGVNLYYNLGNTCFKLDRKGEAIRWYKKAQRLRPRDQDVRSNLEYALSLIEDKIEPRPASWYVRQWNTLVAHVTHAELRASAVAVYWLLCAVLIAFMYRRAWRLYLVRAIAALCGVLVLLGAGMASRVYLDGQEQAVILSREAKVRYGPSEKDVIAFMLHEGSSVEIENIRGDWYQVSLPDGKAGWLKKEDCGRI